MCRWIAFLSQEQILASDVILRPKHSLLKQIDEHYLPGIKLESYPTNEHSPPNNLTNIDGFGIGIYTSAAERHVQEDVPKEDQRTMPLVYRSLLAPVHDRNLQSLTTNLEAKCVLGHIRAVHSQGAPVSESDTHPFQFGRWLLMHNGQVDRFKSIHIPLLQLMSKRARENIKGTTDSEHIAGLFFTFLEPKGPWTKSHTLAELRTAFRSTVASIQGLVECFGGYEPHHWTSLNICITDGECLLASRFAYPASRDPPSLYWSTVAGPHLSQRYSNHPDSPELYDGSRNPSLHGAHFVVGSEPMTYRKEDWKLMEPGQMVLTSLAAMEKGDEGLAFEHINDGFYPVSREQ
ncbi:N-terminal nucleophile aminohydrolase [Meredithblackwellia eburnea MCA 4105]